MFLPVTGWKQVPFGASLVAQSVKKLPAVEETQVQSLGQKDQLLASTGLLEVSAEVI